MGRKVGAVVPLSVGRSGSPASNTMSPRPKLYLHTNWYLDQSSRLVKIDMGQKVGAAMPFSGGELGLPI